MDERSKDPPAEANAAEAGRQHAEADRDKAEQRREDKAEQQEAAEGERRRAEKGARSMRRLQRGLDLLRLRDRICYQGRIPVTVLGFEQTFTS